MDVALQRKNMVESQVRPSDVTDRRIIAALKAIPRELFAPADVKDIAYLDTPLPVAHKRSLLPPRLFAKLIQLAAIEPGNKVLDVAAATGYSSAVIAALGANVIALESDAALATAARSAITSLAISNVTVAEGALAAGAPDRAPFDVIVVEGAVEELPAALTGQLRDGGRLVAVLQDGRLGRVVLGRLAGGTFTLTSAFEAWADLLPGFEKPAKFTF